MIRIIIFTLLKIGFFICVIFSCVVQAQDRVAVDMGSDWLRRDWDDCGENVTGQHRDGVFAIRSDHAAALFLAGAYKKWHGVVN